MRLRFRRDGERPERIYCWAAVVGRESEAGASSPRPYAINHARTFDVCLKIRCDLDTIPYKLRHANIH